jgi:hypothetical protein
MNSSFFTWHVNPAGLSRWGKWGIAPGNLPVCCNLKDLGIQARTDFNELDLI